VSFLLDTNACIALINGKPATVRGNFDAAIKRRTSVFVSSIVQFELWYGVAKSANRERNTARLSAFFAGPVEVVPFDSKDAQRSGLVRAELEMVGRPIGPYDLLISGQALRHKMTLVTANHREFARVKGLQWVDWARE
jgi:tRNA(fMet)-specific endonuclease VapC